MRRLALSLLISINVFQATLAVEPESLIEHPIVGQLRLIPAGTFIMGDDESGRVSERPQHEVKISTSFYMAAKEVTFGQFRRFVSATGYTTEAEGPSVLGQGYNAGMRELERPRNSEYCWRSTGFDQNDDSPVVNVTWHDAIAFCRWVTDKEGRLFRLPTEQEWEYACRANSRTNFHFGDSARKLNTYENVADRSSKLVTSERSPVGNRSERWTDRFAFTAPVGSFKPNAFGLFDMHGNVAEWCEDLYVADRYLKPAGFRALEGSKRVFRGGSCFDSAETAHSARRRDLAPNTAIANLGFRVVMETPIVR